MISVFCLQIRKTLYDNRATIDQYGLPVGTVIDTISAARGMLSAAADSSMNSADEGITTQVVSASWDLSKSLPVGIHTAVLSVMRLQCMHDLCHCCQP